MNYKRHSGQRSVPGTEGKDQIYFFIICQSNTINFSYKARKLDNETNFPKPKTLPQIFPKVSFPGSFLNILFRIVFSSLAQGVMIFNFCLATVNIRNKLWGILKKAFCSVFICHYHENWSCAWWIRIWITYIFENYTLFSIKYMIYWLWSVRLLFLFVKQKEWSLWLIF